MGNVLQADDRLLDLRDPESGQAAHKGLHNSRGAFHCFLNVVIQALWHLRSFRERFRALQYTHVHTHEPCVFCSLQGIFSAYEFSDDDVVRPETLRIALSELFGDEQRFQLRHMDDAEEALDAVLQWLHCEQVGLVALKDYSDVACSPRCISHSVFGSSTCELLSCSVCRNLSDPSPSDSFLTRVWVADLVAAKARRRLSQTLAALRDANKYPCPGPPENTDDADACAGPARELRFLLAVPEVIAVSLVWPSSPDRETIERVMEHLSSDFQPADIFRMEPGLVPQPFALRGFIAYYGKHYKAFFKSDVVGKGDWLVFDDKKITRCGSWSDVCSSARRGKLQPTCVFYEQQHRSLKASRSLASSMLPRAKLDAGAPPSAASTWECSSCSRSWTRTVSACPMCPASHNPPSESPADAWQCQGCRRTWTNRSPSCIMCDTPSEFKQLLLERAQSVQSQLQEQDT